MALDGSPLRALLFILGPELQVTGEAVVSFGGERFGATVACLVGRSWRVAKSPEGLPPVLAMAFEVPGRFRFPL